LPEVVGLVAEYNPFHNGHLYHLQKTRELLPGAYILGVMSGNWTQRGEPAIMNKWARTASALESGVDLILELPAVFSLQSAEGFAMGAMRCLAATGIVNYLCFGSEAGELEPLQALASYLGSEPPQFKRELRRALKKGVSYPRALQHALRAIAKKGNGTPFSDDFMKNILNPNNILALEYLQALQKINAKITPLTIHRKGADYHERTVQGALASATALRQAIFQQNLETTRKGLPASSFRIIGEEIKEGRAPVTGENFAGLIIALLRRSSPGDLIEIPDVMEGMESRLKKAAASQDLARLLGTLKTKRYTRTRLQRTLICLLLAFTKKKIHYFNSIGPQYLRVLGFSSRGRTLLQKIKRNGSLPLVTRPAPFLKNVLAPPGAREMLKCDLLATDLYTLGYPQALQRKGGEDFKHSVIRW
jgi:predicted nucleotidyltransferase